MRLYLSSFRLGQHAGRLIELAGAATRTAVVANALDTAQPDLRAAGVRRETDALASLGLRPEEVDLREPGAAERLREFGIVWLRGGNVFVLRRALADSGADQVLTQLVTTDEIVYAGYSAGPVVLGPSLRGFEHVDDIACVADPVWDGLGVLDCPVVPHVDSPDHFATAQCDLISAELTRAGTAHWTLRDGEVLLVDASGSHLLPRRSR